MLVLSRRRDEKLCIGDSIKLTVLEIRASSVRIGIEAPADVAVHRHEVFAAIGAARISKPPAVCSHPDFGSVGYACRLLDCPVHGSRNKIMSPETVDGR